MEYETPKIVELGSIADLTRGERKGKGKGEGGSGGGPPETGGLS